MFGDFSSFINDPELGLTGVYLSQGSPILDSDWNEQVAALTDWITVVGRLAGANNDGTETFLGSGFGVEFNAESSTVTVHPGMALLGGRVAQSQVRHLATKSGELYRARHIFSESAGDPNTPAHRYLSMVSRILPAAIQSNRPRQLSSDAMYDLTDWAVWLTANNTMPEVPRTVGDSRFQVPRLSMVVANEAQFKLPSSSGMCLVEFHEVVVNIPQFKIAHTPHNTVSLHERVLLEQVNDEKDKLKKGTQFAIRVGECRLLDLKDGQQLFAEYEDDHTAHLRSVKTLRPRSDQRVRLDDVAEVFPVTAYRQQNEIKLTVGEIGQPIMVNRDLRPCLRLWSAISIKSPEVITVTAEDPSDQYLIAGDRWYLPYRDGKLIGQLEHGVAGHRVFRGVAKLAQSGLSSARTSMRSSLLLRSVAKGFETGDVGPDTPPPPPIVIRPTPQPTTEPVSTSVNSRRFDESLHRLTSALDATRAITRNMVCKELSTRVSFTPLRRWLASAYVHEIADLDLEGFLAKVRRSIDVFPDDEHRFREQAQMVLQEANQIGGRVSPGDDSTRWA